MHCPWCSSVTHRYKHKRVLTKCVLPCEPVVCMCRRCTCAPLMPQSWGRSVTVISAHDLHFRCQVFLTSVRQLRRRRDSRLAPSADTSQKIFWFLCFRPQGHGPQTLLQTLQVSTWPIKQHAMETQGTAARILAVSFKRQQLYPRGESANHFYVSFPFHVLQSRLPQWHSLLLVRGSSCVRISTGAPTILTGVLRVLPSPLRQTPRHQVTAASSQALCNPSLILRHTIDR
jgi:hypothetical protein